MKCRYCRETMNLDSLEPWFLKEMEKNPERYKDVNVCNKCILNYILKKRI